MADRLIILSLIRPKMHIMLEIILNRQKKEHFEPRIEAHIAEQNHNLQPEPLPQMHKEVNQLLAQISSRLFMVQIWRDVINIRKIDF